MSIRSLKSPVPIHCNWIETLGIIKNVIFRRGNRTFRFGNTYWWV